MSHVQRKRLEGGRLRVASTAALALPLLLAPGLAGCNNDALAPPQPAAGDMFARYVAVGNSITSGWQSGGIDDSTQAQAYPVLLATAMGTEFHQPLLAAPGCPPPIVNIYTLQRVQGATDSTCALREAPVPDVLNDVAVPDATVLDGYQNLGPGTNANLLTTLFLGGRTQAQAARDADPTFVSVWIGNDDVLGAAAAGDPSGVTPPDVFATRYDALIDSLDTGGVRGGVLVGIVDVTLIPHFSPGVAYWQAAQQGAFPPTFTVDDDCAPASLGGVGETTLVPFRYAFGVLLAQASLGTPETLDCVNDAAVLTGPEVATVSADVAAYNQAIQAAANAHGWAYLDPNIAFLGLRQSGLIPVFPNTTGPDAVVRPFGDYLSRDGVHPSAIAHALIAEALVETINGHYGTDIPAIPGVGALPDVRLR